MLKQTDTPLYWQCVLCFSEVVVCDCESVCNRSHPPHNFSLSSSRFSLSFVVSSAQTLSNLFPAEHTTSGVRTIVFSEKRFREVHVKLGLRSEYLNDRKGWFCFSDFSVVAGFIASE